MQGRYTREGDVRELLIDDDDKFVIAKLRRRDRHVVDAAAPVRCRTSDARVPSASDGFSKEMDINWRAPIASEPLRSTR